MRENLEKGIRYCERAKKEGADIVLFPEMWSNGYRIYDRPVEQWQEEAIPIGSNFVQAFGELVKKRDMAIGITLLEKYAGAPCNSLVLFDRFGGDKN